MTSRLFLKQNSCSVLLVRFLKWYLTEIIQKPEGIILMILVILFLYVALFIKAKPHQQQSSPSKRVFFSAAPSPVSGVQCSPEKIKTMKSWKRWKREKIAPVLEPRSQGRVGENPGNNVAYGAIISRRTAKRLCVTHVTGLSLGSFVVIFT